MWPIRFYEFNNALTEEAAKREIALLQKAEASKAATGNVAGLKKGGEGDMMMTTNDRCAHT